ncbi:peptide/nickel transport system substrate-binding protein [Spinactinospora alkalitolerans]|uniref:Peptide/nickel transport system substrate-binding protein n=1 Tax=Spinactinospora alkalitolerans TaxID=687207 RepID=A0A852TXS5_9ACTN|nr:ABC transporter substrate-binding protein [Spinactinospora alkalitolerans]NYE47752.1 peptide/nickel transport system substrate-binding protein [Spinactinospora alkalitolerans]
MTPQRPRRARPGRAVLAAGSAVAVAIGGCAPLVTPQEATAPEQSVVEAPTRSGGELVVGLDAEPDALDPTLAGTLVGRQVFASMCEKLYDTGTDLSLVPQLAADLPRLSDDGLVATVPLRTDAVFNDGTEFDAEAVKTSLDRHRELSGSSRGTELSAVRNVEVVDDHTVRIELSRPYAPLTSVLADRAGMIMSPEQLDELGEDFGRHPVCVGPFSFVERVAQDRIVVEKSDLYYGADEVELDRITYRAITDDSIRLANLRSGQLDAALQINPNDVATVSTEDGLELLSQPSTQYMGITVNIRNSDGVGEEPGQVEGELARSDELREAFALSLDRAMINEVVFSGLYAPACGPIPPTSEYATEETQACPDFDPDRARELVAESGADTPVPVDMMIPNDPTNLRLGQVVQAMAAETGFRVRLRPTEFASSTAEGQAGNFETYVVGWSGRPDPDGNIAQFFTEGGSNNYSGYATEETDRLIREAAAENDPERRKELYSDLVPRLRGFNSIIYLYRQQIYVAHTDEVAGLQVYPDGLLRLGTAGYVAEGG